MYAVGNHVQNMQYKIHRTQLIKINYIQVFSLHISRKPCVQCSGLHLGRTFCTLEFTFYPYLGHFYVFLTKYDLYIFSDDGCVYQQKYF